MSSLRMTSSELIPSTETRLSLDVWPRTTRIRDLAIPSLFPNSSTMAAFALPSTGAAFTLTHKVPSRTPSTSSREALGCTFTLIVPL